MTCSIGHLEHITEEGDARRGGRQFLPNTSVPEDDENAYKRNSEH